MTYLVLLLRLVVQTTEISSSFKGCLNLVKWNCVIDVWLHHVPVHGAGLSEFFSSCSICDVFMPLTGIPLSNQLDVALQ
jgi:hypothetical protein